MRAGPLDRRITIRRLGVVGDDGYGNQIIDWADVATLWAGVSQASGREFFAAAAVQTERRMVFRIRWRDGITTQDRVVYAGRTHDIHEVRELGRRAGLELHTTSTE